MGVGTNGARLFVSLILWVVDLVPPITQQQIRKIITMDINVTDAAFLNNFIYISLF